MLQFKAWIRCWWFGWVAGGLLVSGCAPIGSEGERGIADGGRMQRRQNSEWEFVGKAPLRVVATVGMVADLVRAVGGPEVEVHTLMGPGVDPHLYKASRDDVREILQSDVVVACGLMLEGKLQSILRQVAKRRPVYWVTAGIPKERLLQEDSDGDVADPHVWMDVQLWSTCLAEVERIWCQFDPARAAEYRRRAADYRRQLDSLHSYARQTLQTIPASQRVFVTSHDAFQYFGRAYGLEVTGVQGLSTESEAGLRRVNELVHWLAERQVPAVFFESSVPQRSMEAVIAGVESRGHRLRLEGPLYSDALGPAGTETGTYLGMMAFNINEIARHLGGQVPEGGWRPPEGSASVPTMSPPATLTQESRDD